MRIVAMAAMLPLAACATAGSDYDYGAVDSVECGMNGSITTTCPVSVRSDPSGPENWFVTVTRPNGLPRAIFYSENNAWGADGAEADGSAAFQFESRRDGSRTIISFGPERYIIPDSVIPGY